LNDLPPSLKVKHQKCIKILLDYLKKDPATANEKIKQIMSNTRMMFSEKLERLDELANEVECRECDRKHRLDINDSLKRLEHQIQDIENDGVILDNKISQLEDESQVRGVKRE